MVCENYATQASDGESMAGHNPPITLHFTPPPGRGLNLVEIFFGIITRQAIRRATSPPSAT